LKGEFAMAEKIELEVEKILELGIEFLKMDGVPSSMAFFYTPKGKFCIDRFDFRNKPNAIKILRKIAEDREATMVIVMANAHESKFKGTDLDPPYFRREVLFVWGETKYTDFGISQQYERKENGKIKIGKKTIWPKGASIGQMTGFLNTKNLT
jgi:hypothetical protein